MLGTLIVGVTIIGLLASNLATNAFYKSGRIKSKKLARLLRNAIWLILFLFGMGLLNWTENSAPDAAYAWDKPLEILFSLVLGVCFLVWAFTTISLVFEFAADVFSNSLRATRKPLESGGGDPANRTPKARTPGRFGTVAATLVVVLGFVWLLYVILDAWGNWPTRVILTGAQIVASEARLKIVDYQQIHRRFPPTLEAAGFSFTSDRDVRAVEYDARTGAIRVVLARGETAGGSITYTKLPDRQGNVGKLDWQCTATDMPKKYLRYACPE